MPLVFQMPVTAKASFLFRLWMRCVGKKKVIDCPVFQMTPMRHEHERVVIYTWKRYTYIASQEHWP